jgi:hypothetical protein
LKQKAGPCAGLFVFAGALKTMLQEVKKGK